MAGKRYMSLEYAAQVLCLPQDWLLSKLRLNRAIHYTPVAPEAPFVNLYEAAKVLGMHENIAKLLEDGREWLMASRDIKATYGHDERAADKISGGVAFETPHGKVYQVTPFIRFLVMEPEEKRELLEGKRGKVQNKRAR